MALLRKLPRHSCVRVEDAVDHPVGTIAEGVIEDDRLEYGLKPPHPGVTPVGLPRLNAVTVEHERNLDNQLDDAGQVTGDHDRGTDRGRRTARLEAGGQCHDLQQRWTKSS